MTTYPTTAKSTIRRRRKRKANIITRAIYFLVGIVCMAADFVTESCGIIYQGVVKFILEAVILTLCIGLEFIAFWVFFYGVYLITTLM